MSTEIEIEIERWRKLQVKSCKRLPNGSDEAWLWILTMVSSQKATSAIEIPSGFGLLQLNQKLSSTSVLHSLFYFPKMLCSCAHNDLMLSNPSPQSLVRTVCSLVFESFYEHGQRMQLPPRLNLSIDSDSLSHEHVTTIVASLADEGGSMVALSFFYWAIGLSKFRHFMRLYIVCALSLISNGNFERAHEVMQCMLVSFSEIGRLKEAGDMILDMQNQGLMLTTHILNSVLVIACEINSVEYAEEIFEEMSHRGVSPDSVSYRSMVVGYCRNGGISDAERWLGEMLDKGFVVDNSTLTLIISTFSEKGLTNRAFWGSVKKAFEMLEEMVSKGWKPNVYTHTALIDGLCKKGWTEKAFRLFLKLVRSNNYKPNVHTYTTMISGYCREQKMNRAEMLLSKMIEQGLVPNTNTYTTLVDGHCKDGNFDRAYQIPEAYRLIKEASFEGIHSDRMVKTGLNPDMYLYTTLIAFFCREKRMKESEMLFRDAIRVGLIPSKETYTSMICGYCRIGNITLATHYFQLMTDHNCAPDSFTFGALISGLCKEEKLDEARKLYDAATIEKGLSPCEVTRVTLAYEYCKREKFSSAMAILERLEKRLWIRTVNTLVRKLCSDKKVGMAALFFHKLVDKDRNVDRVTMAAFMAACYESNKYALVSELSERIGKTGLAIQNS
ncbi:hypothetical protein F8388_025242 [Cannabis sativa]|uniref:Pentatricopeptide repeat-containing protein n=1 Tax=Cannabis sativa TaxID=3483 RepID=A0A7J6FSB0_CANSA|nr:hypothetical protein F8388_025242 [Cannabis sativa]